MKSSTKKIIVGLAIVSFLWIVFLSGSETESQPVAPAATATPTATAEPAPTPSPTPETRRAGQDYGQETEAYFKQQFISGCNADGSSAEGCSCMYDYLRAKLSVEQMTKLSDYEQNPDSAKLLYQAAIVCEEDL